jgi:antitoxin component of MazEF toxin-antitoxin module
MIIATTKKWGNSLGLRIKKEDVIGLELKENEDVIIEIQKKVSPLKLLWGLKTKNKITRAKFLQNRKSMESKLV